MRKVISFTPDLQEKTIPRLRELFYGKAATSLEYRDSFVINEAVDRFSEENAAELMSEKISALENEGKGLSKTVNFRADSYLKLSSFSESLGISPAETCRRILYYSADNIEKIAPIASPHEFSQLKAKILLLEGHIKILEKEISFAKKAIGDITTEISNLEKGDADNDD